FNNILTAILGNAGLALSKLPATSPINSYISNITQASHKAADLCKQMLAYSGKGQFIIKPILLSELVEDMKQLLHVSIAKNVVLRLDLSTQIPAINADVTQMQQVIMNLVINAAEAIDTNSGSISISTGVMRVDQHYLTTTFLEESLELGQYVYLEVSDTGCGMSEETQKKIFEPFFTTKFTGRGLGMAAILGIVRGHNGAIKVYSEENKGSTFKLLFPCSEEKAESLASPESRQIQFQSSGCVLVVDDEETIREVAESMLKDLGLTCLMAADGIEAIEVFKKNHATIDVVLLDMTMPRMGGEDTFSELCRIDPDVKVILSSGYTEQDATNRFTGKGLAGFLQKPYAPQLFAEKLSHVFNKTDT
ncbi:MAG: response regulator, partial [Ghiorsea sp.]|nr:response regulator [Ghiorsea sp.]